MPNATTNAILDHVRAALPGVADDVAKQALFDVCDDLAREALRVAAPVDIDADPATWLPAAEWVPSYQALLAGTFAALYGQFGKPYFSPDLAKANLEKYLAYRTLSRATQAGAATSVSEPQDRANAVIRQQISGIRDEAIKLEMFHVVNAIRADAYRLAPIDSGSGSPTDWLTEPQWNESLNAIVAGTLAKLLAQSNMPWFSAEAASANSALYQQELHKVRQIYSATAPEVAFTYARLVSLVRSAIPTITDAGIKAAAFAAVNNVLVEGFHLPPTASGTGSPADWMTVDQYNLSFNAIVENLFARLYGQSAMPWGNEQARADHAARYQFELTKVRGAISGSSDDTDTIAERIVSTVRAQVPLITDVAIKLALFDTCNRVRVDALRMPPIDGNSNNINDWFTAGEYQSYYNALLPGTLANVYGQAGMPWHNRDLFVAQTAIYLQEVNHLRVGQAGTVAATDTTPERIVSAVRAQIQLVRDESVKLEMYNVVNKIRREVYQLPALTGADTDYTTWLSAAQYEQSYLTILHGTLSRLYAQSNMPWFSLELFNANNILFGQELDLARSENIEPAGPVSSIESILEEARAYLPGARDEVLEIELRRALDEFLKVTSIWQEDIRIAARRGYTTYQLYPTGKAEIVRVVGVVNKDTGLGVGLFSMQNIGTIRFQWEPSDPATYLVTVVLSILTGKRGTACTDKNYGVPDWIIERWNEVLLDGLLWRMMMQPQKSYTDTKLGLFHGQRWRQGLADARGSTRQQNVYDGQTWRYPEYA